MKYVSRDGSWFGNEVMRFRKHDPRVANRHNYIVIWFAPFRDDEFEFEYFDTQAERDAYFEELKQKFLNE